MSSNDLEKSSQCKLLNNIPHTTKIYFINIARIFGRALLSIPTIEKTKQTKINLQSKCGDRSARLDTAILVTQNSLFLFFLTPHPPPNPPLSLPPLPPPIVSSYRGGRKIRHLSLDSKQAHICRKARTTLHILSVSYNLQ